MFNLQENYKERFVLPDPNETADFSAEDLADDMEGLTPKYPRLRIVPGGANQFEIVGDPDNPQLERQLDCIILFHRPSNAYWQGDSSEEGNAPTCQSFDGKIGIGTPGGLCRTCDFNQFGSGIKDGKPTKGKMCKNSDVLYLLFSGEFLPRELYLPPTSIGVFKKFCNDMFVVRRRCLFGSLVRIGLVKKVEGTNNYSVATFKLLRDFEGEEFVEVSQYARAFRVQAKAMLQEQATVITSGKTEAVPALAETADSPQAIETAADATEADYIVPHSNPSAAAFLDDDFDEIVGEEEFPISA